MVVHCLTFANVPGLGSLLRADAWPEGLSISIPQNGPILVLQSVVLDAFGVPPFLETSIYLYL